MIPVPFQLQVYVERWPIAGRFSISRGSKTEAVVVVVEISRNGVTGRGECVPYPRYNETPEAAADAIHSVGQWTTLTRETLRERMPPGAARNALDCALWDLEAKEAKRRVWELAGLPAPRPLTTAYTISLGTPEEMAQATSAAAHRPLLKIKLGGEGDEARIAAVRRAAPDAALIVDANEAWSDANLQRNLDACAEAGVALVEQPLPAGQDAALERISRPIPVCADESAHATASLMGLAGRYDAVNIKLDKTGGLTEALAMRREAERLGLKVMVGCMVATSLAMAPALIAAQQAFIVDLDGPLLLARDREPALHYEGSTVHPPEAALWG
ncbi:dipeptide epimerase [[Pseudomonas] carboxydohydrogena]|uniref:Dipeptide epimerase n=1 Tax=Afipia carboxydohydrogena TaxID=290 RepID=A0ABY8BSC4_AFICR|nr:N-acetyl-D-Glu racemase DgcA [[Pseudomonas] carboxydohydrogena]WEF52594.1 dipeptide epimerase [[Pseudomonas] carboxydohydrogena]